jgi:hypothetical protein
MPLIRCTAKLLVETGLKPSPSIDAPDDTLLGQWHANLLHIDRRKSLLFVNDKTLFNFVVPDVSRSQVRDLPALFLFHLSCVVSDEGITGAAKARLLSDYADVGIGKSSDRSVLGSANELAFHYKYSILQSGGVHSPLIPSLIRQMNRMPLQRIGFAYPVDHLKRLCANAA